MSPEELERLDALLETDVPLAEIAAAMGYSYHTFRIRMAETGQKIVRRRVDMRTQREASSPHPNFAVKSNGAVPVGAKGE